MGTHVADQGLRVPVGCGPTGESTILVCGALAGPLAWRELPDLARPEWWLFNVGLWCALLGVVAFVWWLGWRLSSYLSRRAYYVAFLASRLLQRKRIAFFSVGAVTLCVAMMIIVKSVMGGFVDSIRERANGLLGHLVIGGSDAGLSAL